MLANIRENEQRRITTLFLNSCFALTIFIIYIYKEFLIVDNIVSFQEKFVFYCLFYVPLVFNAILTKSNVVKKITIGALFIFYVIAILNILFVDDIFGRHFFIDFYYAESPIRNINVDFSVLLRKDMIFHNLANVALLFPAGCFSYYLFKSLRNPFLYTYVFVVSDVCIEALQFVFAVGVFDLSDITTNLIGVALAYIVSFIADKTKILVKTSKD